MNKKKLFIWIGVAVLVIVLIVIILKKAGSAEQEELKKIEGLEEETDAQEEKDHPTDDVKKNARDCRKICRTKCRAKKQSAVGIWAGIASLGIISTTRKCKNDCKSVCASKGVQYIKDSY